MSRQAPRHAPIDGSDLKVAVAAARFNQELVDALLADVCAHLRAAGVRKSRMTVVRVPGSNELPSTVQLLFRRRRPDVCIALGVIIRGETRHFELVADASSLGLMRVALAAGRPVINGIIVAENARQAEARCRGRLRRGAEFAQSALEMAALRRAISR